MSIRRRDVTLRNQTVSLLPRVPSRPRERSFLLTATPSPAAFGSRRSSAGQRILPRGLPPFFCYIGATTVTSNAAAPEENVNRSEKERRRKTENERVKERKTDSRGRRNRRRGSSRRRRRRWERVDRRKRSSRVVAARSRARASHCHGAYVIALVARENGGATWRARAVCHHNRRVVAAR